MRRLVDLFMLFGYLAGFGLIAWILFMPTEGDDATAKPAPIRLPMLEPPPLNLERLSDYDPIIDRPLFRQDRMASIPEALTGAMPIDVAPTESVARVDGIRLTAVFRGAENHSALVELPNGDSLSVREGDRLKNWQVLEISDQTLVLGHRSQRQTLSVHDFAYLGEPAIAPRSRALRERAQRTAERGQSRNNRKPASVKRQRRDEEPEERD